MKEGVGDAGSNGDEIALALGNFDLACAREVGKIDGTSATDAGGGGFVGSDGWKLRQQLAGGDEQVSNGVRNSRIPSARFARAREGRHSTSPSLRGSKAPAGMTNLLPSLD